MIRKMKGLGNELTVLFDGFIMILYLIVLFALNFGFMYFLTDRLFISILVGVIGMLYFFFVFAYQNQKLRKKQESSKDLLKYTTNVIFYLGTGENVINALRNSLVSVGHEVRQDIQKTIDILEKEARLETSHFKKYEFPSLNQFHQNLFVKYEHGGSTDDLFSKIQNHMSFELKKQDELYRKKKGFSLSVYTLIGMVAAIMVILRLITPELWDVFMSVPLGSLSVILGTYILILANLYFLQKHLNDISVRI